MGRGNMGPKNMEPEKYGTEKIWDERIPRCLPPLRFLLLPIFGRVLCERDASWWNTIQKGRKKEEKNKKQYKTDRFVLNGNLARCIGILYFVRFHN